MAKTKEQLLVQLKVGLVFKKFLDQNKEDAIEQGNRKNQKEEIVDSYGKLDLTTGLRKATLINVFKGRSNVSAATIVKILEGLGKTMTDFGNSYDSINNKEVLEYQSLSKKQEVVKEKHKVKNNAKKQKINSSQLVHKHRN